MSDRPAERGPSGTGHDTAASERVLNRVLLCPHRKYCLDNGCAGCCEQDPPLCRDGSNVTHRSAPDPPVAVPGPASERPHLLRLLWNRLQAKLHHSYPCRKCGYAYNCPDGGCHS